jgi:hypothetical protein
LSGLGPLSVTRVDVSTEIITARYAAAPQLPDITLRRRPQAARTAAARATIGPKSRLIMK